MKTIVKIILIGLFIGCLFDMPYGYFQLVRFAGMVGFAILAYAEKKDAWKWTWIASAILIQPFVKIALGREIWNIVDIVWAILLATSILTNLKPKQNE